MCERRCYEQRDASDVDDMGEASVKENAECDMNGASDPSSD